MHAYLGADKIDTSRPPSGTKQQHTYLNYFWRSFFNEQTNCVRFQSKWVVWCGRTRVWLLTAWWDLNTWTGPYLAVRASRTCASALLRPAPVSNYHLTFSWPWPIVVFSIRDKLTNSLLTLARLLTWRFEIFRTSNFKGKAVLMFPWIFVEN